jgi:hypothetical protein
VGRHEELIWLEGLGRGENLGHQIEREMDLGHRSPSVRLQTWTALVAPAVFEGVIAGEKYGKICNSSSLVLLKM